MSIKLTISRLGPGEVACFDIKEEREDIAKKVELPGDGEHHVVEFNLAANGETERMNAFLAELRKSPGSEVVSVMPCTRGVSSVPYVVVWYRTQASVTA